MYRCVCESMCLERQDVCPGDRKSIACQRHSETDPGRQTAAAGYMLDTSWRSENDAQEKGTEV